MISLSSACLITLSFPRTWDYPTDDKDPKADFVFIYRKHNYMLSKKILMRGSSYYKTLLEDQRREDYRIHQYTKKKFNPIIFNNIMHTFMGLEYRIKTDQDFYHAYLICQDLGIQLFLEELERVMTERTSRMSFACIYQLTQEFQNELKHVEAHCLDLLHSDVNIYKKTFDMREISSYYVMMTQLGNSLTDQAPKNILQLNEETFLKLIEFHNSCKKYISCDYFISYEDVYKIVKFFYSLRVKSDMNKSQQEKELKDTLRAKIPQLIDSDILTASEYENIFHKELVLQKIEERDRFDPIVSENILLNKKFKEIQNQSQHMWTLRERSREKYEAKLRQSTKQILDAQRNQQLLEEKKNSQKKKAEKLEQELARLRMSSRRNEKLLNERERLVEELTQRMEWIQRSQNECLDMTQSVCVSELNFIKQLPSITSEHEHNQIKSTYHHSGPRRDSTQRLLGKNIIFDQHPRSVYNKNQFDCLLDFFQPSIFETISLKLIYRSSQHGAEFATLFQHCRYTNDFILIFTTEYDKVFGLYLSREIRNMGEPFTDSKAFLFSVTHGKKMKQKGEAIFNFQRKSIEIGQDINIMEINSENNYPIDFEDLDMGPDFPAGASTFEISEVEAYKVNVNRSME